MNKQQFIENFVCQYMATWAATHSTRPDINKAIWEAKEAWQSFRIKLAMSNTLTVREPYTLNVHSINLSED